MIINRLGFASMALAKKYDIVVYGATGFTGQYVVEELARVMDMEKATNKPPLKWAIAGRNEEKLKNSLSIAEKETGLQLKDIDLMVVDNKKDGDLKSMTSQAKCVVNCVGPYQTYGEPVIKACIENQANHVDISGEPQFLEGMQLKYNTDAEKAGVHIVGACGFDSIPADVGVSHMSKQFQGRLNSVECYLRIKGSNKSSIHTGTMESAAMAVANGSEIKEIRRQLYPEKLPKPKFPKERRSLLHKNTDLNIWALHFPSDESQVYRSQRYYYDKNGRQPIQFQGFVGFRSFFQALGTTFGVGYFLLMSFFSLTRSLLIKFPEFMTAGVFSRKGPEREVLKEVGFTSTLIGKGWSEKLENETDQYKTAPDTKVTLKITAPDPGYGATSLMMVASAMTIIREKENCTGRGGVWSPGAAFMNTNIVDRMTQRGVTFTYQEE